MSTTTENEASLTTTTAVTACATCDVGNNDDSESYTGWFQMTTTFTWSSASWIASATQPICTWEGHCLGDTCTTHDACDRDWECRENICQPCCSPAVETQPTSFSTSTTTQQSTQQPTQESQGLGTGTAIGIGVSVPVAIAIFVGVAYLLWRARRKKRDAYYRQQGQATDDLGKPELEGSGHALEPIVKRSEMDASTTKRAELADNIEIATEAEAIAPIELEDTSRPGRHKYEYQRVSEPPSIPQKTAQDNLEEVHDAISMYRPPPVAGVIPSPTPPTIATPPTIETPPPDWPLPRATPVDSPYATQTSGFRVSPESESHPPHLRMSPVSTLTSPRHTHTSVQRSPRRVPAPAPILPPGMIDRFDDDDDDDDDGYLDRRREGRSHGQQGPYHQIQGEESRAQRAAQEYIMFGWPSGPGDREQRPP